MSAREYHVCTGSGKRQHKGLCGAEGEARFKANVDYTLPRGILHQIEAGEVIIHEDCLDKLDGIRKSYIQEAANGGMNEKTGGAEPSEIREWQEEARSNAKTKR